MASEFEDKVVLITGASGTIGTALTQHFLALGAIVYAQINTSDLEAKRNLHMIRVDFKHENAAAKIIESAIAVVGKIDFLINNAANQVVLPLDQSTAAAADEIFHTNVSIPAELIALASKAKVQACLNISSIEANIARPGHSIYGASKAALDSLTRSAGQELFPMRTLGLRLGLVGKAGIDEAWPEGVNAWKSSSVLSRYANATEVARVAEFLLSCANAWATGTTYDFDGGIATKANW
ncbi:MAG: SDR family oxidoreductase [Actinomycetes bacterium]